jgi:hypothetical protein
VVDISIAGYGVHADVPLSNGANVWLRLPGLEARLARVIWVRGSDFGSQFSEPLHPAVLDMVVARAVVE